MANRFWVGGNGTWDASSTTNWSSTSGGSSGASAPTSSDNVFFDANSGSGYQCTISGTASCLSLDCTGSAGGAFFTGGASDILQIFGNLTLVTGTGMATNPMRVFICKFKATTTGWTIDTKNRTGSSCKYVCDGVGGGWTYTNTSFASCGSLTITNGTFTLGGSNNYLGTSSGGTGLTLNGGTLAFGATGTLDCDGGVALTTGSVTGTGSINCRTGDLTVGSGFGSIASTISFGCAGGGTGPNNITTNGKTLPNLSIVNNRQWQLGDALNVTTLFSVSQSGGSFNTQNFAINAGTASFDLTNAATITLGSSIISLSGSSGTVFTGVAGSGTLSAGTSEIRFTDTGASNKTFAGGGLTYYIVRITAGGAGIIIFTGANTFNEIICGAPKSMRFPSSTTQTMTNINWTGTAGNLITITSSSAGTAATISKSSGTVACAYLSLKDSAATGGATFTASNSTNVSGNSGWAFVTAGVATFSPSASLACVGRAFKYTVATMTAHAALNPVGQSTARGEVTITADTDFNAIGQATARGAYTITADTDLNCVGKASAQAVMTAVASTVFNAIGQSSARGVATFVADSDFAPIGEGFWVGTFTMTSDIDFTAQGASNAAVLANFNPSAMFAPEGAAAAIAALTIISDTNLDAIGASLFSGILTILAQTDLDFIGRADAQAVMTALADVDWPVTGASVARGVANMTADVDWPVTGASAARGAATMLADTNFNPVGAARWNSVMTAVADANWDPVGVTFRFASFAITPQAVFAAEGKRITPIEAIRVFYPPYIDFTL